MVYVFNYRVVVVFEFSKSRKIRARSDLREVVGPSKQASKQANIHTHGCNEVMLVWGSLRLAPMKLTLCYIVRI